MQSKKLSSATSMDIKFGSSLWCPDYTMLSTSLTVKTSFGKKKQFGESVNSNFLDRKEKEEFLLLLNVSFSVFKLEFHTRNCTNNAQWKPGKLSAILVSHLHVPLRVPKCKLVIVSKQSTELATKILGFSSQLYYKIIAFIF